MENNRPALRTYLRPPPPKGKSERIQYDYTNQAWLVDGRYRACGHPAKMRCQCYGKLHAGEPPAEGASIH